MGGRRSDLDGGVALAGAAEADVLGGQPGAAAVGGGDGENAGLAGVRRAQERLKDQHHAPIAQVLLVHCGLCSPVTDVVQGIGI